MAYGEHEEWRVEVAVPTLLTAAQAKTAYHDARLAYWRQEYKERVDDLQENGITFTGLDEESRKRALRDLAQGSNTYRQPQVGVQLDQDRVHDVTEAQSKVEEHSRQVETYSRWVRFFNLAVLAETPTLPCGVTDLELLGL